MVIATKLKSYLDKGKVDYEVLEHKECFTSPEIAQSLHIPGHMLAKVVIVAAGDRKMMAVIDANHQVDLEAFALATGEQEARLVSEHELRACFPDCEVGAMPPFGTLYNLPVFVDRALTRDKEIVFEAGNHHEAIRLRYEDFDRLVRPRIADFGRH